MFLTRDPVEGVMARVASRNGYGYVEGNPVNWTDPSGRVTKELNVLNLCGQGNPVPEWNLSSLAQEFAACLIDDGLYCDLEFASCSTCKPQDTPDALGKLIEFWHQKHPEKSTADIVNDISMALLGTSGVFAPSGAQGLSGLGNSVVGFHPHYQQRSGQVYHFWAFFTSACNDPSGRVAINGDWLHECAETNKDGSRAGTVEDARLSTVAIRLGVKANQMNPTLLAQNIRETLRSPFEGELLDHYRIGVTPEMSGALFQSVWYSQFLPDAMTRCIDIGREERATR